MKPLRTIILTLVPILAVTAETAPGRLAGLRLWRAGHRSGRARGLRTLRTHAVGQRRQDLRPLPQQRRSANALNPGSGVGAIPGAAGGAGEMRDLVGMRDGLASGIAVGE
jgi:hypothetical protein